MLGKINFRYFFRLVFHPITPLNALTQKFSIAKSEQNQQVSDRVNEFCKLS